MSLMLILAKGFSAIKDFMASPSAFFVILESAILLSPLSCLRGSAAVKLKWTAPHLVRQK